MTRHQASSTVFLGSVVHGTLFAVCAQAALNVHTPHTLRQQPEHPLARLSDSCARVCACCATLCVCTMHAGVRSTRPLAALVSVDASAALEMPGVVACFTARDIPGSNSVFQQPLLAGQ